MKKPQIKTSENTPIEYEEKVGSEINQVTITIKNQNKYPKNIIPIIFIFMYFEKKQIYVIPKKIPAITNTGEMTNKTVS
jgi:hypothetical protein